MLRGTFGDTFAHPNSTMNIGPMKICPFLVSTAAIALLFAACTSSEGPAAPPVPTGTVPSVVNAGSTAPSISAQAPSEPTAPSDAVAQLNPPHGQPGHRCEIPVGAPLDGSAPASSATTPITLEAPATVPTATSANPMSGNSGKINPPHGEPGHDCAVPVGSPLP